MSKKLVLTPLGIELKYLIQSFRSHKIHFNKIKVGKFDAYTSPEIHLILAVGGHGKTQFALHTQYLIGEIKNLSGVLCVGGAGGLSSILKTHDIVIGEKTIEHDFQQKFIKTKLPEFEASTVLISLFRNFTSKNFKSHQGIIASGDEDIMDSQRAREVHHLTQALAVAWEGAGGARACLMNDTPYLEIRGITDLCTETTSVDFSKNIQQTMDHLCEVLIFAFKS